VGTAMNRSNRYDWTAITPSWSPSFTQVYQNRFHRRPGWRAGSARMPSRPARCFSLSAATSPAGPSSNDVSVSHALRVVNAPVAPGAWPMQRFSPVLVEMGTRASIRIALRTVHGTMQATTAATNTTVDRSTTCRSRVPIHQAKATTGTMASEMGRTMTASPSATPVPSTRRVVRPSGQRVVTTTAQNARNKVL